MILKLSAIPFICLRISGTWMNKNILPRLIRFGGDFSDDDRVRRGSQPFGF